ncbi:hypothetical protein FOG18_07325 [Legionella israelensis]|uniref:hypothetical protein n=1 Tax=Legionella israelensis TaxID=454 RepID=UPI00117CED68|nr:hypothetical protein [Legionella israelensis]QDP72382.1 hypothetical protein FOG18_07325 [Legionella israelensis]
MKYKSHLPLFCLLSSVLLRALNPVFFKMGAASIKKFTVFNIIGNIFCLLSFFTLFLIAIVWQQTLKYYPLTFAYSFLSIAFFVILIMSHFLFNEPITIYNVIGLILISTGIITLSFMKKQHGQGE